MATVTYVTSDGAEVSIPDAVGSLMEIATANNIDGIEGACGGVCACCTCHVKVRPEWLEKVGRPLEVEQDVLDDEDGPDDRSRLGCQVEMRDDLDGLVVEVVPL